MCQVETDSPPSPPYRNRVPDPLRSPLLYLGPRRERPSPDCLAVAGAPQRRPGLWSPSSRPFYARALRRSISESAVQCASSTTCITHVSASKAAQLPERAHRCLPMTRSACSSRKHAPSVSRNYPGNAPISPVATHEVVARECYHLWQRRQKVRV